MRYSEDTKKFWKVGWRIFGGRFINFMTGYKNDSQVVLGDSTKGQFMPETKKHQILTLQFRPLRFFGNVILMGSLEIGFRESCQT